VFRNAIVLSNGCIMVVGGQTAVEIFSDNNAVLSNKMYCPSTQTWSQFEKH
jgi:hypothetical protein